MIRTPRRVILTHPPQIPARTALQYELTDSWPSVAERRRYWSRSGIPSHLRRPPDPRKYLTNFLEGSDSARNAKVSAAADFEAWKAERIEWLRRQANG